MKIQTTNLPKGGGGKTTHSERAAVKSRKKAAQSAPKGYSKKGRYPFALHEDVRYEKLEDLVAYYGAKSASDYLESLIIKEWEKMQRKLKNKEK